MSVVISNIQSLLLPNLFPFHIKLDVKRDDLIDPIISGNKSFKLREYIKDFQKGEFETLMSFGGAYSNHLHAMAYTGQKLGIKTVGFVRAEPHELQTPTPTLQDCLQWGMELVPISRSEYRLKSESSQVQAYVVNYDKPYWVPEGGSGELGVKGAEHILSGVDQSQYDYVVAACGTGTTLAGLIRASEAHVQVIGIPVLKGANWMEKEVAHYLLKNMTNWSLKLDYHFSGYGKWNSELTDFIEFVFQETALPLEPVYTGKAFYGLLDLIQKGEIRKNSRVLFIHTGGLQGVR
ncbi:pyridoxal-phosphate dependent enzyme [Oceaniserpentilla sp. 4NH20-0058]|uniref:1-aminocyclopropane-1-carboxylate deaminase/D-cysteine desulfhydrase n=1 Tax=Oceaniserpentilla sp. 4NH20-0058 TaxID=3127660 RepID=UPI003109992B